MRTQKAIMRRFVRASKSIDEAVRLVRTLPAESVARRNLLGYLRTAADIAWTLANRVKS